MQILLDQAHISPGLIDGYLGEKPHDAVRIFERREGLEADGWVDEKIWSVLSADSAAVLQTYEISDADLAERYVRDIPEDYGRMAEMEWLGYTSPKEMLAERFHMDQSLLEALNPGADFAKGGFWWRRRDRWLSTSCPHSQ